MADDAVGVNPGQPILSALALVENCFIVVHIPAAMLGDADKSDFVDKQLEALPGGLGQVGRVYVPSTSENFTFEVMNLRQTTPIYE